MLPVVAHAVAVLGDEHKASHWLSTPLAVFGDRSPSQVLATPDGVEVVEPLECNYLLNPGHPEFTEILVEPGVPFVFDERLFK
jgi:hypothetical protein